MAVPMESLITDIGAETAELWSLIAELPEGQAGWDAPTPAAGWAVRDQISHLAFFDDAAVRSATDPEGFTAEVLPMLADGRISPDTIAERYRPMPTAELLSWFDGARRALVAAFAAIDPSMRVPWFGLPMSAASSLTARIMETWAHGQDIADALGVTRVPSARLRHVAHIGVGARAFSYMANGLEVPEEPVRVELTAPGARCGPGAPTACPTGSPALRTTSACSSPSAGIATTPHCTSPVRSPTSGSPSRRPSPDLPVAGAPQDSSTEVCREGPGTHRKLLGLLRRPDRRGAGDGRGRDGRAEHRRAVRGLPR